MSVLKYKDPVSGEWKPIAGGGTPSAPAIDTRSVKYYGAKGDGVTDDTSAFKKALAAERVVTVPGGTYYLNGELRIRGNCGMILSQDTVLNFAQTSGNCISMEMSASIRGNHGLAKVSYGFSGHVVNVNTDLNDDVTAIEPWNRWDPQWKAGRYITDLNITKHDANGFCYANKPEDCNGTAIYISADRNGTSANRSTFIWGLDFSGIRIAGAFSYGIRAVNFNQAWNHEMRIEAFITNCEIGVSLEDCNNAYISATIEPRYAENNGVKTGVYAKHGIQLVRSTNADLSGSRVWDWNDTGTKWQNGNQWQHIGMYGDCHGAILNSFEYYDVSIDIRKLIYTDTQSNLEKITILQEPITRWFKPIDGVPYFSDGSAEKKLMTQAEFDSCFEVDSVKKYTDALATATDLDGSIYNGKGYTATGGHVSSSGLDGTGGEGYYGRTGYIYAPTGSRLYTKGISMHPTDGWCGMALYDGNKALISEGWCGSSHVVNDTKNFYIDNYTETDDGFIIDIVHDGVEYVRISTTSGLIGDNPIISINEPIKETYVGYLADGINVKGESVILTSPSGKPFSLSVSEDGTLSVNALS